MDLTDKDDIDSLVEKLLIIELKHYMRITRIEVATDGKCSDLMEVFPIELHTIALDLLGVPKDRTIEDRDSFCRDWLCDSWCNYDLEDDPEEYVKSYIKYVHSEMSEFRKKYYN